MNPLLLKLDDEERLCFFQIFNIFEGSMIRKAFTSFVKEERPKKQADF